MTFIQWLTLLFIGLKLTHYIDWAWWWVLSPILIVFVITFVTRLKRAFWGNSQYDV